MCSGEAPTFNKSPRPNFQNTFASSRKQALKFSEGPRSGLLPHTHTQKQREREKLTSRA